MNTYERMFFEDVQDKKRIGRGTFSRRGKGVKHTIRGIKTAYDFMSTKERKKLNSEVRSFNMYENILTRDEFDQQERETQKAMLTKWRELYENAEIMAQMGIKGSNTYHKYIKDLEVPKKSRGGARTRKGKTTAPVQESSPKVKPQEIETVQQTPVKILINGLHLEYNGIYDADQLAKIFTKLQLLVDSEESDFYLTLTLTEEQKPK